MAAALFLYIGGVLVGLLLTDARLPERVVLAVLWPVGPLAFIVTVSILLVAAAIAFPIFGIVALALAGAAWWFMR